MLCYVMPLCRNTWIIFPLSLYLVFAMYYFFYLKRIFYDHVFVMVLPLKISYSLEAGWAEATRYIWDEAVTCLYRFTGN